MNKLEIEKSNNTELVELDQETKNKYLTPNEEYRKGLRRRRGKAILFVLLLLVESFLGILFVCSVIAEDLHYRVTREIENSFDGKNQFKTGTYTGETDFGYFIGEGTFEFTSGTVYTGQWSVNEMNGLGKLNIPSEGTYEGEFLDSKKSGKGAFTWNDGTIYDGEWKNDQMDGQGVYTSPNQMKYVGTFKENCFWQGTCEFENETGTYIVTYKEYTIDNLEILFTDGTQYNGATDGTMLNGTGNMQFANGDQYTGKFENGIRNGQGVYVWGNGDSYDGTWDGDTMSGSGKYTYADGSYAQGEFDNNQFIDGLYTVINSFGEYIFKIEEQEAVSVEMNLTSGTQYSGEMKDEKLTGTAQITYGNGDKYSGTVKNGRKSGYGSYSWSSGASYEGEWKNDKMNGLGTYLYPDKEEGYKLVGNFKKGIPDGEVQYYVDSSESYKTDWKNGKCIKVYE